MRFCHNCQETLSLNAACVWSVHLCYVNRSYLLCTFIFSLMSYECGSVMWATNDFSYLFIYCRGRGLNSCYLNPAKIMPSSVIWIPLKKLQWEGCLLLCLMGSALVCLVPMAQTKTISLVWSVWSALSLFK